MRGTAVAEAAGMRSSISLLLLLVAACGGGDSAGAADPGGGVSFGSPVRQTNTGELLLTLLPVRRAKLLVQ